MPWITPDLGTQIQRLRAEHDVSQRELAQKLGFSSPGTVSQYENGYNDPNEPTLRRINEIFGTDLKLSPSIQSTKLNVLGENRTQVRTYSAQHSQARHDSSSPTVAMREFVRDDKRDDSHMAEVRIIAHALLNHLNSVDVLGEIMKKHVAKAPSQVIQDCFIGRAQELGFHSEKKRLFESYETRDLRPDYYRPLGSTGIILEVERGRTIANNMDLLDLWKCHICEFANYLFLIVPKFRLDEERQKVTRKEFAAVSKRLGTFFKPNNYTNVYGLWLFGYPSAFKNLTLARNPLVSRSPGDL